MLELFKGTKKLKEDLIKEQQKKLQGLYEECASDIQKRLNALSKIDTESAKIQRVQLQQLQKDLDKKVKQIGQQTQKDVTDAVNAVAQSLQDEKNALLQKLGINYRYAYIPEDVVKAVLNGEVYNKKQFLSKSIWKCWNKNKDDINTIVAKGIAEQKSTYDIAKELEKYVKPNAKKPWDWSKVYPHTNKVVDYNAQRLARTLINHAHQQAFKQANDKDPFVKDYVWYSALIHGRTCDLCRERDGKHFKKDDLPMDHPNGLCTWGANIQDLRDVAKQLVDWGNSPPGTYPEIDEYAKSLVDLMPNNQKQPFLDYMNGNINKELVKQALTYTSDEATDGLRSNTFSESEYWKGYDKWAGDFRYKFKPHWRDAIDDLPMKQKQSLLTYTGDAFEEINPYLRGLTNSLNDDFQEVIKETTAALKSFALEEDLFVHRGTATDVFEWMGITRDDFQDVNVLKQKLVGTLFQEKGFMSTSTDINMDAFVDGVDFLIKLPKGANGAYIESISYYDYEQEFLLPPGSSFVIKEVKKNDQGVVNIYMELLLS